MTGKIRLTDVERVGVESKEIRREIEITIAEVEFWKTEWKAREDNCERKRLRAMRLMQHYESELKELREELKENSDEYSALLNLNSSNSEFVNKP